MRLARSPALLVALVACGNSSNQTTQDAAPPSFVHLTLMPSSTLPAGAFVAYDDGFGTWRAAPAPVAGVISLPINGEVYGVAVFCNNGVFNTIDVSNFTLSDPMSWSLLVPCAAFVAPTGMLSGTITTIANTDQQVNFGASAGVASSMTGTSVNYAFAATPGPGVLFATRNDSTTGAMDRMLVQRNFTVGSATTRNIDFTSEGDAPVAIAPAANSDFIDVQYFLGGMYGGEFTSSTSPVSIYALPVAQRDASDKYFLFDEVTTAQGTTSVGAVVADLAAPTIPSQPPLLVASKLTTSGADVTIPIVRPAAAVSIIESSPCIGTLGCTNFLNAQLSDDYTSRRPTWTAPDFSAISGWQAAKLDATRLSASIGFSADTGTYPTVGFTETTYSYALSPSAARVTDPQLQRAQLAALARGRLLRAAR